MEYVRVNIGDELEGEWTHGKSRERLIVLCHGYQGSNEDPTIVYIATALNKLGYDTFTFNFSPNTGGFDIEHQVGDIRQITEHFAEYKRIVLLAASFAALTASIAARQGGITELSTLNGFFGLGLLGGEHRKTYHKFRIAALVIPKYRRIYRYYKQQLQPQAIEVPVLVLHAEHDKYVLKRQSEWFYQQLTSPKKFIKLETANHGVTDDKDRDEVVAAVDSWLKAG